MSDYIAWYTVELRLRLTPHMNTTQVETIVREARSHLSETAERLKAELQIGDERAQFAAIEAFGSIEKVSLTYLREQNAKVLGMRPVWMFVATAIVMVLCWDFHWMSLSGPFDNYGETWQNGLAGVLGFVALVGLVAACRAGKRSFRLPLLATGAGLLLALPLFASYYAITDGSGSESILRPHIARAQSIIPASLKRLDDLEGFYKRGSTEFATANSPAELSSLFKNLDLAEDHFGIERHSSYPAFGADGMPAAAAFVTPVDYVYSPARGGLYALRGVTTFAEAKKRWKEVGPTALEGVGQARRRLHDVLALVQQADEGRLFFFNGFWTTQLVCWTVIFLPALFLIDGIVFAWTRRRRAWPTPHLA